MDESTQELLNLLTVMLTDMNYKLEPLPAWVRLSRRELSRGELSCVGYTMVRRVDINTVNEICDELKLRFVKNYEED